MAKRGRIGALVLLIAAIGAGGCAEPVRLQFRPQIGQKQALRVTFRLATTHPARAGQDVTEHAWTFTVKLEPLAISPDGSVTIKVGILRARQEFFMHSQSDIRHHLDTANGSLEGVYAAFLGESFTIVVSPQGELVKLNTDAFYAAIAENRIKHEDRAQQINEKYGSREKRKQAYEEQAADFLFYGTNQLRTLLTNLLAPLAAQSVKPGDHWSGPVMLRLEGLMELAGTYTFKGLNSGVCTLQAEARRSMDDQPIGPPLVQAAPPVKLAGTYQATIRLDPTTGSLLSKEAVMELQGTAPMPNARTRTFGDPVPITTKATVTVEPVLTIQTITAAPNPAPVSTAVTVGAAFSGPDPGDEHKAMWDWGDGTSSAGTVVREPGGSGNGSISGSHIYTAVGIYTLKLTVIDKADGSDTEEYDFLVIYDPTAGFVTGGGWIDSPAGAYKNDPSLTGRATFGFVSKYQEGATVPAGNTAFQFKAGSLNFRSRGYDWPAITGSDYARFKGTGTINGAGAYKFQVWARDAASDTFRIRIWTEDESTGAETDVYDNGFDQAIGGGSIMIHTE